MERRLIRVLLVDDEPAILTDLESRLAQYPNFCVVGTAGGCQEAVEMLERVEADLVFTDIQMADGTGFGLARMIQRRWPGLLVVFLTGFSDFAVEGYEYQPLDFLVKPVGTERLERALAYALKRLQAPATEEITVGICTENGFRMFHPSEISYAEKVGRRVRVLCRDGGEFWVTDTLSKLEDLLEDYSFYRCHQSYLVSLGDVIGIQREQFGRSYCISLRSSDAEIPLSRRNYPAMLDRLKGHWYQRG